MQALSRAWTPVAHAEIH